MKQVRFKMSSICVFNFQMSDNSYNYPPSRKRPGENPDSGPDLCLCEHPMETDNSGDTASEHENGNKKKMKKSDSNEKLGIESEKSKVKFYKLNFQKLNIQMFLHFT
jgi:hypothetical protein